MQLHSVLLGFLGGLGAPEIILIALIVLLLFGGKKIPELMRGMGKGVKNFKEGMSSMEDEINKPPEPKKDTEKDKPSDQKSMI